MSEFVNFLVEVFEEFGEINSRKMFGGYGIYHDGLMFGLVADDELYLKADKVSLGFFEERGLEPFKYIKNNKAMKMSYYLAPEEIYDERDAAKEWADRAYEAAQRSKKKKK